MIVDTEKIDYLECKKIFFAETFMCTILLMLDIKYYNIST